MKKLKWKLRRMKRIFNRTYKGYSDIIGVLLIPLGAIALFYGWVLLLCGEASSVLILSLGFGLFGVGYEMLKYGRSKC